MRQGSAAHRTREMKVDRFESWLFSLKARPAPP
jgi:hypothetical protein